VHGARLNVEINLGGLSDANYKDATGAEVTRLTQSAAEAAETAAKALAG